MWTFIFAFVILFAVTFGFVLFAQAALVSHQKSQVRKMLRRAAQEAGRRRQDLMWETEASSGVVNVLRRFHIFQGLESMLAQAGMDWSLEKFVIVTAAAALAGVFVGSAVPFTARIAWCHYAAAGLFATFPFLYVSRKRSARFAAFEEQFPEALNFLSRSMRAGHAFTIGLEMLVADAPEPLASCFRKILNNLQLGSPLESALAELVESVPLIDVRFFVSSVLLQQGTGGNLGEILDTMARIIRERFQVKGSVKAASAHGRVTGLVLSLMPMVVGALMAIIAPGYITKLITDPLGIRLLEASVVAQLIGFFCVRKITTIKV